MVACSSKSRPAFVFAFVLELKDVASLKTDTERVDQTKKAAAKQRTLAPHFSPEIIGQAPCSDRGSRFPKASEL